MIFAEKHKIKTAIWLCHCIRQLVCLFILSQVLFRPPLAGGLGLVAHALRRVPLAEAPLHPLQVQAEVGTNPGGEG